MYHMIVGVGQVSLLLRHARSLKDKRQVIKSIKERLKNQGFSVSEIAYAEEAKQASVGFAYVGSEPAVVQKALDDDMRLFVGDWEILQTNQQVFDYSDESLEGVSSEEEKYDF